MNIYSIISQKSYYSKFMDACLINQKQPFQIEFFSRQGKSEVAKKIPDLSILDTSHHPDLNLNSESRLFSERAMRLFEPFIELNKLEYNVFFYEQMPFYAFNAPSIIPANYSDEDISKSISLETAIQKHLTPHVHYFQLSPRFLIYVTDSLCQHLIQNKVSGIEFQLEWEGIL